MKNIGFFKSSGIDKKIIEGEKLIKIINYVDIYNNKNRVLKNNKEFMIVSASENQINNNDLKYGDILFTPSSETIEDIGISCVVEDNFDGCSFSYHLLRFRLNNHYDVHESFKKYLFNNQALQNYFSSRAVGTIRKTLNRNDFKNAPIILPPLHEQEHIARYLDDNLSKINMIISDTQQSIEELKKYKQSLITEVVTKGLDKNVEMKDSGIEWIGEIPLNSQVFRIKNLFSLKGRIGWQGLNSNEYRDEGAHLITGTDFNNGEINWDKCVRITHERYAEAPEIHIKENDLLITKDGTIGKVAITKNTPKEVSLNSGVLLMRKKQTKHNLHLKMMYYLLLSNVFWDWYNMNDVGGSTIKHLYQNQFYDFSFPLFEDTKQIDIIDFLDNKIGIIDTLITDKQRIINEYESYKKSLIYEYVTGKKEVREEA